MRSSYSLQQQKSVDLSSTGGGSEGTALYRYGQEVLQSKSTKSLANAMHGQSSFLLDPRGEQQLLQPQVPGIMNTGSHDEETVASFFSQQRGSANSGKSLKVVSGSQFRLTNHSKAMACDQCEAFDRVNKKNKELIRSLKLQLMRMEENFRDLKYSKAGDSLASDVKYAEDPSRKDENMSSVARKCEYLEDELTKFKKMLSYERTVNEGIRSTLEEDRSSHKTEVDELRQQLSVLKEQNATLESLNAHMQRVKDDQDGKMFAYKQQLEKAEQRLAEALLKLSSYGNMEVSNNAESSKELEKLKKEIERLESLNKGHQFTIGHKNSDISQLEDRIQELTATVGGLEGDNLKLTTDLAVQTELVKVNQEQAQVAKKRCDVLESTVKITIQERDVAKNALAEKDSEINSKNKKLEVQEVEIRSLNDRINDLLRRMSVDGDNSKRALEKAITSSVRLCVVAPTVNVHVNDVKHKFKSRISEKGLKQFLDSEIFEKYCFLYKQASENTGPTGGNLESWLQKMLAQMQNSIEAHVNSAMDGSSL